MVPAPLNKTHSAIREHVFAAYEDAKQAGVHLEERIAKHVHAADERKKLFSEIPRIEGERIILDRVVDADADALRDLIDNPFAQRYLPTYGASQEVRNSRRVHGVHGRERHRAV